MISPAASTVVWQFGCLPDSDTSVLVIDTEHEIGEAAHDGEEWRWSHGGLIGTDVICWADLPDPEAVLSMRDAFLLGSQDRWELTEAGKALLSGEDAP